MPSQRLHDPFADEPLRPTTSNPSLRDRSSQQSLRSGASAAAARSRPPPRDLLAPSLSRRPTSRATRHAGNTVLEDLSGQSLGDHTYPGKARASPERKHSRSRAKQQQQQLRAQEEAEWDIVNRSPDGGYLLASDAIKDCLRSTNLPPSEVEAREADDAAVARDGEYVASARHHFTSGAALGERSSKRILEDTDEETHYALLRLREMAMNKIERERWMYEPLPPHL